MGPVEHKNEPAATALAPHLIHCFISLREDKPPAATRGMGRSEQASLIRLRSGPAKVPSLSTEVSKISPTPLLTKH